jgi:hypothetical protein
MNGDTQAIIIALYTENKRFLGTIRLTTIASSSAKKTPRNRVDGFCQDDSRPSP